MRKFILIMSKQFKPTNENKTFNNKGFFAPKKVMILAVWSVILIAIITVSSRYVINVDFNKMKEFKGDHNGYKWLGWSLLLAGGYFFYSIFGRIITFWIKVRKVAPKIAVHSWFEFAVISIFIQIITPFSIGSEPYAVWWLKRKGVPLKNAVIVIGLNSFLWSFSQVLLTWPSFLFFTINNQDKIAANQISWAYWLVVIGLVVDVFMMFLIFALNYSRHLHVFLSKIFNQIKSLLRLKHMTGQEIVDKYKVNAFYKKEFKQALLSKSSIVILFVMAGFAVIPYLSFLFLYHSYDPNVNSWEVYHIINIVATANNFLPLPGGGEGSIQYILKELLQSTLAGNISNINNSVFLWRAVTAYSLFFLGAVSILIVGIVKAIRKIIDSHLKV